jgi:peptide/nickel transport system substrate-binding protein
MRKTVRGGFGLLLLMVSAACGKEKAEGAGEGAAANVPDSLRYGGTAVIASYGDLQSMNALVASDFTSNSIMREMLFMPLVKYDEKLNVVPWLAASWDTARVAGDSLDLTFHLRRDVKWHDGQPTTAEDVKFTYERAIDPRTGFPNISAFQGFYSPRVVLVDPYTVRFRMRPHAEFLDIWYQTPIMPKHLLGSVPPEQLITHPFGTTAPVGNGPFRFVRRIPGQEWVFEANPAFSDSLGGRPYLDRIVYRNLPEQTTLLTELLTGRVDVYLGVNPAQAEQVKASRTAHLSATPFRQWVYIAWNTRLPMFSDARVRRALTMAIDRQAIVEALVHGYGEVGRASVTPAHWSYDPRDTLTLLPHDTAAARKLLTEAGWQDRDRNGVLEDAQGREFRFTLKTNQGNDLRKDITEIVQAQLRPLGIVVEPRLVEWNTLIRQLQGSATGRGAGTRDFEAVVNAWVDDFRKNDADILHSRNLTKPYQYVGYANTRVDSMIDTLNVIMDRQQAAPIWREYQRLLATEAPYTVLYYPQRLAGINRRLQGVKMDVRGDLSTVGKWWILPSERTDGAPAGPGAGARDSAGG